MAYSVVGKGMGKLDGRGKATGGTGYVDDLTLPGMLYGRILRSQYPHARILHIDTSRAERLIARVGGGAGAVLTGCSFPQGMMGPFIKDEQMLATDKVRFIGEPVAAVAAVDGETAEEAVSLIRVDYEELPPVFDPLQAMSADAPLLHEGLQRYEAVFAARRQGNICSHSTIMEGEIERGWQEAEVIVEETYSTQMVHQVYMEPNGAVAQFDINGKVTVWTSTQSAFITQARIAEALHLPMTRIRVIGTAVGGGFGGKVEPSVQVLCAALAQRSGRPVKLVLSREEEFVATKPRHPAIVTLRTGARRDGTLVARQARLVFDTGAYANDGPGITAVGARSAKGPYRIPHVQIDAYCVYTNKAVAGAFRGFGNPQATFAAESQLDALAEQLGIDPLELRLKNALEKGDIMVGGQRLHSVGLKACLRRAAEVAGWGNRPLPPHRGLGIACLVHISGVLSTSAFVKVNEDGTIVLITGANDIGQGSDTTLAQIAAEELGIPLDRIAVAGVDTDFSPYNWATDASRTTFTVGKAVQLAAREARGQLLRLAAETLEADVADLEIREGRVSVRGASERGMGYPELSAISHWVKGGPILGKASLMVESPPYPPLDPKRTLLFGMPSAVRAGYIFGAHVVEVEVDVETGQVTVVRAVAAHDVGQAINPIVVEGQIEGGLVQGLGYGLWEEMVHDGGKVTNPSLVEYRIPSSLDIPSEIVPLIVEEADPDGPFGAKGVGEPGLVGTAPALANAVYNAVGVRITDLPITPEKVLRALRHKKTVDRGDCRS